MLIAQIIVYFFIYSFLGWILETIYCSILKKRLIIRGFLVGPYCPIYGFGSLFVLATLSPFEDYMPVVLILAIIITSALEYFASFALEKLFNKTWWDYSHRPFNLHGRIYLLYSLIWGALCLLLVYVVHPIVSEQLRMFSDQIIIIAAAIISVTFIFDTIYSVRDAIRFNKEIAKLTYLTEKMDQLRNMMMTTAGETRTKAEKELAQLIKQNELTVRRALKKIRRIVNAFPTIRHKQLDVASIRERINGFFIRK